MISDDIDGVEKVYLKYHNAGRDGKNDASAVVLLGREIRESDSEILLRGKLSHYDRPLRHDSKITPPFEHLCGIAAVLLRGDVRRQTARLIDRQTTKKVRVEIETNELPREIRAHVSSTIRNLMEAAANGDDGNTPLPNSKS